MRRPLHRLPPMRLILIVVLLFVVVCGALFGALNGTPIALDFYFLAVTVPTGVALLCALLAGWLLGGLIAWLGHVPRLRRELRSARRDIAQARAVPEAREER
ncbi:MAG: lipopolysaccharide assembly protein LapA domain-containing protein [Lysobacterales bacterium]